ncbi:hypothetical protein ZWY2020_008639 [Hordeum vulgare]|nr:hypothetical protein ZWY2020_008639 [Hordeum vulgare]
MPKHYRPAGKKKEGNAAKYITRTKAVKYLQISLAVFRKLCILKGVFPREPKKKVEGNHKTYYHMKDIAFLAHDPLIEKFREIKVHRKKVKKAYAKKNRDLADRLLNRPPTYKLDRLIIERYPSFVDALRDLDDCLTMVHLFAALPAIEGERVQVQRIHNCRRICELKLYHSINVNYPPILDSRSEALSAGKYWYFAQLQHQLPANEPGALMHLVEESTADDTEEESVPRESLLFIIPAFGGTVSWEGEGAPFDETDQDITHQIVDRPTQSHVFLSRQYVQPQWIFDCVNILRVIPTDDYIVGRVPPPHLSPFVDNDQEGHMPDYAVTLERYKSAGQNQVMPLPGDEDLGNSIVEAKSEHDEFAKKKRELEKQEKKYHDELKMEIEGTTFSNLSNKKADSAPDVADEDETQAAVEQAEKDADDIAKSVVSRKKRGLMEAMKISNDRKKSKVELLKQRKKAAESSASAKRR